MKARLTFTCAKHAEIAKATGAIAQGIDHHFVCVEEKDVDIEIMAGATKIVCDFSFGGNLNGGIFLKGYAGVLDGIFAQGFDVVEKCDSDAGLLKMAILNDPIQEDVAHVRGVRIGGCLSGGCYVINRHVPDAIRAFVEKYQVPDSPTEPDPSDPKKTRKTTYTYDGPVFSNRWTPTAEDLCVHRAVIDAGGIADLEDHYWKPLRHPMNGLPPWAPVALLDPLLPERIPALCKYVQTLIH
ncbi:MAG: hypothetical protein LBV12_06330 [Puniceicoccales bacterium]|jgi:hypothetical protein|nr:hypothetical protein [Puniceicoccales bacterium]